MPVALAVFTRAGGQTSVRPCSRVWTSRKKSISARCRADPAPVYTGNPEPAILAPRARSIIRSRSPISQCGRRSHAGVPLSGSGGAIFGRGSPHVRIVRFASLPPIGDVGVGGVRDAEEEPSELGLDRRELRVDLVDATAGIRRRPPELGDFRAVGPRPAADGVTDLFGRLVAFGLEAVAFTEKCTSARVDLEGTVDDRRVLALVDRPLSDRVRLLAQSMRSDAHLEPSAAVARVGAVDGGAPPASRSRRRTNSGSRLASSQPARGPLVRPRNATYSAPNARPAGSARLLGHVEDQRLPRLAAFGSRTAGRGLGRAGQRREIEALLVGKPCDLGGNLVVRDLVARRFRRVDLEPARHRRDPLIEDLALARRQPTSLLGLEVSSGLLAGLKDERQVQERRPVCGRLGDHVRVRIDE